MIDRDQERLLLWWGTTSTLVVMLVFLAGLLRADAAAVGVAASGRRTVETPTMLPGYVVGEFTEPPTRILTRLDGQETVTLQHLLHQWPDIIVPVSELRLVNPRAPHSRLGTRVGQTARRVAASMPKNSRFLPSAPRVACAAFVSYILVKSGGKRISYAVNTAYPQLRKRGAQVVAARVSTKYAAWFKHYRPGDILFFHKGGSRLGHVEISVGGGLTAGTSSSMMRVAIRPIGNRGYRLMSVLRL